MKKFLSLFAIASLFVAGFSSCDEDDATYTPASSSITITTADVLFEPQASTGTIVYEAKGKVSFSTEADWISLSQTDANTISVEVEDNSELLGRTGVVVLSDGNGKVNVIVQQKGLAFGFYDGEYEDIPVEGETYSIEAKTSFEVTFQDCPDWIHFTQTESGYDVDVDANASANHREALVTIVCQGKSAELYFSQLGCFNFESKDYTIPTAGDSTTVIAGIVTADTYVAITGGEGWFSVDTLENGYQLYVAANPDPTDRVAVLTLYCEEDTAVYTITQIGTYFNVMVDGKVAKSLSIGDADTETDWDFKTNANVALRTSADWLTAEIKETNLHLTATENAAGHMRSAWIYYTDGSFSDSLCVNQFDFQKDICSLSNYLMFETSEGTSYMKAAFTDSCISLPSYGWSIPATFDPMTASFNFQTGCKVGTYSSYDVYLAVITSEGLTMGNGASFSVNMYYSDADTLTIGEIVCNEPTLPYTGLFLAAFSGDNYAGYLIQFPSPYFLGETPESSEAAAPVRGRMGAALRATAPGKLTLNNKYRYIGR